MPELTSETDVYIATLGDVVREADKLARDLRSQGINVESDFSDRKLDKKMKTALKKEIPRIIFVGEQEVTSGSYMLKDLKNNTEHQLDFAGIVELIKEKK
jgi:histidyl-tRNA synthetase